MATSVAQGLLCHIEGQLREGRKRTSLMNNNEQAGKNIAAISFATSSLQWESLGPPFSYSLSDAVAQVENLSCSLKITKAFSVFCKERRGEG